LEGTVRKEYCQEKTLTNKARGGRMIVRDKGSMGGRDKRKNEWKKKKNAAEKEGRSGIYRRKKVMGKGEGGAFN